jgi:TrkA domain protein
MPVDLRETRLPGIGVKYGFRTSGGGRLAVVLHNDGNREIYFFRHAADDEPAAGDPARRRRGPPARAVIGGAYERPKIIEDLEMALRRAHDRVECRVPEESPCIGQRRSPSAAFVRRRGSR